MSLRRKIALVVVAALLLALTASDRVRAQALPDLTVDRLGFTFMGKDEQGNCEGKLRITVKNLGGGNAGPFTVGFTIAGVPASIAVAGLQAGSSVTLTPEVVVPTGTSLVRVGADVLNTVIESNEVNNTVVQFGTCPGSAR